MCRFLCPHTWNAINGMECLYQKEERAHVFTARCGKICAFERRDCEHILCDLPQSDCVPGQSLGILRINLDLRGTLCYNQIIDRHFAFSL